MAEHHCASCKRTLISRHEAAERLRELEDEFFEAPTDGLALGQTLEAVMEIAADIACVTCGPRTEPEQ